MRLWDGCECASIEDWSKMAFAPTPKPLFKRWSIWKFSFSSQYKLKIFNTSVASWDGALCIYWVTAICFLLILSYKKKEHECCNNIKEKKRIKLEKKRYIASDLFRILFYCGRRLSFILLWHYRYFIQHSFTIISRPQYLLVHFTKLFQRWSLRKMFIFRQQQSTMTYHHRHLIIQNHVWLNLIILIYQWSFSLFSWFIRFSRWFFVGIQSIM